MNTTIKRTQNELTIDALQRLINHATEVESALNGFDNQLAGAMKTVRGQLANRVNKLRYLDQLKAKQTEKNEGLAGTPANNPAKEGILIFDKQDYVALDDAISSFCSRETIHVCSQCKVNRATKYSITRLSKETWLILRCESCTEGEKEINNARI